MTIGNAGQRRRQIWRGRLFSVATIGIVLALPLAACSSSKSSDVAAGTGSATTSAAATSSAASPTSACVAAAQTFLKPWDTFATSLPQTYVPLAKRPAAGGSIVTLINGTIPSDEQRYEAQKTAAQAVGWTDKVIVFDGTVEDLNSKLNQAIATKPTAIAVSGWPAAAIEAPLAKAKSAGIIVGLGTTPDQPTGNPGYAVNTNGGPTSKLIGEINAYEFLRDSNCKGDVAIFNLPFPILKVATDEFMSVIKANCPDCKVSYSEIEAKDIGTPAATNAIVSRLQSSTTTKYVYTIIGNVAAGLPTALSQANITGIKIFGEVPDANAIAALRNGTNAWWVDQSIQMEGWTELDGILRALQSGSTVTDNGNYPLAVLTQHNVPSGSDIPVIPADYEQEFKKLWLVS
jgi:ABC-type sugar transport system substrate-binding protein